MEGENRYVFIQDAGWQICGVGWKIEECFSKAHSVHSDQIELSTLYSWLYWMWT